MLYKATATGDPSTLAFAAHSIEDIFVNFQTIPVFDLCYKAWERDSLRLR